MNQNRGIFGFVLEKVIIYFLLLFNFLTVQMITTFQGVQKLYFVLLYFCIKL